MKRVHIHRDADRDYLCTDTNCEHSQNRARQDSFTRILVYTSLGYVLAWSHYHPLAIVGAVLIAAPFVYNQCIKRPQG
jgi:hypothetical protein